MAGKAGDSGGGGFNPIQNLSGATFGYLGGAVQDIFGSQATAKGLQIKAMGDIAEGQAYDLASQLATQNAAFTEQSTAIKEMQQQRELTMSLGETRADVAASGFAASGSSLDLLRESASQGALAHQVLGQQGLITEAGYKEQAQSYQILSAAAKQTATAEQELAKQEQTGGFFGAALKGAAAIASILPAAAAA